MRASPAFQVSLQRFGVWQGGVLVIALLGSASLTAWVWAWPDPAVATRLAVVTLSVAALLGVAWPLARVPPVRLRWDGQVWSLTRLDSVGAGPRTGELLVAIDLGPWMLLKFFTADQRGSARCTWLPVQRRGLEPHWHALRCAVHAPRPAVGADRLGRAP